MTSKMVTDRTQHAALVTALKCVCACWNHPAFMASHCC